MEIWVQNIESKKAHYFNMIKQVISFKFRITHQWYKFLYRLRQELKDQGGSRFL